MGNKNPFTKERGIVLKEHFRNIVFVISSIFILLCVILGIVAPKTFGEVSNALFSLSTEYFGWFYLISVFIIAMFLIILAISKFGKIKLGGKDAKPEFKFFSWIALLFSTGLGIGLVFWGVAEPMSHFYSTPFQDLEPLTPEAARIAMAYSFFHWGISQWSVFAIMGLVMGYMQFNKKKNLLISTALEPVIGKKQSVKNTIDILAVIATVMGVATSIGLGALQTNGGLNGAFGFPTSIWVQVAVIGIMFIGYILSSVTGLHKGMKILSNLNLIIALVLLIFVFITGPSVFIIESFVLALNDYITHFIEYSLRLQPYLGETWVKDWTIFYWAWAIAWSPFVGSFVARVSRGRTIREFVFGVLIVPPLVSCVWITVFGGTAIYFDLYKGTELAQAVNNDITVALFQLLDQLPLTFIASIVAIILIFIFLITSADSATFIMGSMTSKGILNPSMFSKIVWGILMAAIASVLLFTDGLNTLQTASLISALPFTLVILLLILSFIKMIKHEPIPITKREIRRMKQIQAQLENEKHKDKNK